MTRLVGLLVQNSSDVVGLLLLVFFLCLGSVTPLLLAGPRILNQGVTAVHVSLLQEGTHAIYVGTKNGKLLWWDDVIKKDWREASSGRAASKFPIFSLDSTCSNNPGLLFCGCGDRYATIWKIQTPTSDKDCPMQYIEEVGPHTGWVKAVTYDGANRRLYSVGCNCIETWERTGSPLTSTSSSNPPTHFSHKSKHNIENSPTSGSTLSGDLLCLCLVESGRGGLLSGGVDGRIHLWSDVPTDPDPQHSLLCHQGRVNSISLLDETKHMYISVGNDGKLCVLQLQSGAQQAVRVVNEFVIDKDQRLTSCVILKSTKDGVYEGVLGTTQGQVIYVELRELSSQVKDHPFNSDVSLLELDRLTLQDMPPVYDICLAPPEMHPHAVLVGHAVGLDIISTIDA